jgi:hypothetical protein
MRNIEINCGNTDSLAVYKYIKKIQPSDKYNWDRPESWLDFPNVVSSDQVFYALFPVTNTNYNTASISVQGAFIVDWGDGIVENFGAAGGLSYTATHNYSYWQIPSSTGTPFGYRQAIIKVTPQAGNNLTQIGSISATSFLDIIACGPYLVVSEILNNRNLESAKLLCRVSGNIQNNALKYIEFDENVASIKSELNQFLANNEALQYVTPFNTSNLQYFSSMFSNCRSLIAFPELDLSLATNISSMCQNCNAMVYFPPTVFDYSVTTINAFSPCNSLRSIDIQGRVGSGNFLQNCQSLLIYPAVDLSESSNVTFARQIRAVKATGMRNSISFSPNSIIGRSQLVELFYNLGTANPGAAVDLRNCPSALTLTPNEIAIATLKGFQVIVS